MTSTTQKENTTSSSTNIESEDNMVKVMNDHDLNVIDEALLEPEKPEYSDHFGFTVQVKEDTEYDQDTTDSEECCYEDASTSTSITSSTALNQLNQLEEEEEEEDKDSLIKEEEKETNSVTQMTNNSASSTAVINDNECELIVLQEPSSSTATASSSFILTQPTATATEDWQFISSNMAEEKLNNSSETSSLNATTNSSFISAKTSPTPVLSYYDILLSKFSRSNTTDRAKQVQLKQETSHNLELLKEKSKEETDWGKSSLY